MNRALLILVSVFAMAVQADDKELIAKGKTLFMTKICFTCHQTDPVVPAPAGVALRAPMFLGDFWGLRRLRRSKSGRVVVWSSPIIIKNLS